MLHRMKIEVEIDHSNPKHIDAAKEFLQAVADNTRKPYESEETFLERVEAKK